jgi:S1-C subfamily serine protease
VTVSFFNAALSVWRATYSPMPGREIEDARLDAVVKLSIQAVSGARTAATLGAEREGTGAVISDDGLILTIGYLILEAASILVVTRDGRVLPATVAGFDHATGFGLLRTQPGVTSHPLRLGDSSALDELHSVSVATHTDAGGCSRACIVARRRFTGWWEYMIEDAIFAAPPRAEHSGAALIDAAGALVGIGSLWVGDALEMGVAFPGNMFVPVDLLKPVLDDLIATGRRHGPARPWLGLYSEAVEGHLAVTGVLPGSPAEQAGLHRGDVILGVGGLAIGDQGEFYQRLWASGEAGADITLHVLHDKIVRHITVHSADRLEYLLPWKVC